MARDIIARGMASEAIEAIGSTKGIQELTTEQRQNYTPSEPVIVFDIDEKSYYGYSINTGSWRPIGGSLGVQLWGLIEGSIYDQLDLMQEFVKKFDLSENTTDDITEGDSLFVSQAEKNKWNGLQTVYIVENEEEKNNLTDLRAGDSVFIITESRSFIWDGNKWRLVADKDWANVNIDFKNLINVPDFEISWEEL